jgi:hypothetical protein
MYRDSASMMSERPAYRKTALRCLGGKKWMSDNANIPQAWTAPREHHIGIHSRPGLPQAIALCRYRKKSLQASGKIFGTEHTCTRQFCKISQNCLVCAIRSRWEWSDARSAGEHELGIAREHRRVRKYYAAERQADTCRKARAEHGWVL